MTVRALERGDLDAAVEVLTSAFAGDELLVWACGVRERQGMRVSCRMTIKLSTAARAAYGYFDGERLISVALYQRSEQLPTAFQSIRAGFWQVPIHAGPRAAMRIMRAFERADAFKARLMGDERYLYLDTLGAHRDAAGRGVGQKLLRASLSRLREETPRSCFLLTHQPHNVRLYQRLGFQVIGECPVPDSPITFWGMRQAN
jgi:ribosomal protein S18 acetylase RimI-like enzyme